MQINYYPWNTDLLQAWVASECSMYADPEAFSKVIGIPSKTLLEWRSSQFFEITLDQIHALARYLDWTFAQTVLWLGIKDFHLEELERNAALSNQIPFRSLNPQVAFEPFYSLMQVDTLLGSSVGHYR